MISARAVAQLSRTQTYTHTHICIARGLWPLVAHFSVSLDSPIACLTAHIEPDRGGLWKVSGRLHLRRTIAGPPAANPIGLLQHIPRMDETFVIDRQPREVLGKDAGDDWGAHGISVVSQGNAVRYQQMFQLGRISTRLRHQPGDHPRWRRRNQGPAGARDRTAPSRRDESAALSPSNHWPRRR